MNIKKISLYGFIFTVVLGIILHFVYELSNGSFIASIFGNINESTWEHLKLIFWPIMIFGIFEYYIYGKDVSGFWTVKIFSALLGMLAIVASFYTYSGIIGKNFAFANIATFIFGAFISYLFSYKKLSEGGYSSQLLNALGYILIAVIIIIFISFTFSPPNINIFADPKEPLPKIETTSN